MPKSIVLQSFPLLFSKYFHNACLLPQALSLSHCAYFSTSHIIFQSLSHTLQGSSRPVCRLLQPSVPVAVPCLSPAFPRVIWWVMLLSYLPRSWSQGSGTACCLCEIHSRRASTVDAGKCGQPYHCSFLSLDIELRMSYMHARQVYH